VSRITRRRHGPPGPCVPKRASAPDGVGVHQELSRPGPVASGLSARASGAAVDASWISTMSVWLSLKRAAAVLHPPLNRGEIPGADW